MTATIVTVQIRAEWPSKDYTFRDERQANAFAHRCRRDGDFSVSIVRVTS